MAKRRQKDSWETAPVVAGLVAAVLFGLVGVQAVMGQAREGASVLGISSLLAKGGDDDSGGNSGSGSSNSGSSDDDGDDDEDEAGDDSSDDDTRVGSGSNSGASGVRTETRERSESEDEIDDGVRTRTEIRDDGEVRTEVRFSEEERIRTRTKDGKERIDVTSNGVRVRLEQEDGRVVVKAEREGVEDVELEDETILKIDDRLAKSQIRVATASADRLVVGRDEVGAVTDFPLTIDLATNTLAVNTPAGQRNLQVLPDEAIGNLLSANVINRIGGRALVERVRNGEITSLDDVVSLVEADGDLVYEIRGVSDQRLLGFIPVEVAKEVTVSAETGEVIETEVDLVNRLVDLLSL